MHSLSLAALLILSSSATLSFAGVIPRSMEGNTLTCQDSAGCISETIDGRVYKVLRTPQLTVRVSLSTEGGYTRADVSISNNSTTQLDVLPADFRVDVLGPRPHTLGYVEPASRIAAPVASALSLQPRGKQADRRSASASFAQPQLVTAAFLLPPKPQPDLTATGLLPEATVDGKVFFARDPRARSINLVLPISGAVFEFPFQVGQ